jgi:hypothetical protein
MAIFTKNKTARLVKRLLAGKASPDVFNNLPIDEQVKGLQMAEKHLQGEYAKQEFRLNALEEQVKKLRVDMGKLQLYLEIIRQAKEQLEKATKKA